MYEVPHKKINEADGGGWDVVYKEYDAAVLPDLDAAALAAHVDLLGELSADEGRWLCDKTAWPAAVVERGGHACGFLMRAVPDRFRFRFTFPSLPSTTTGTPRLASLEYLLNDDDYVAGIGLAISERDRLLILADLAATLARLHRIGITVGDLSPKDLLFTTDPKPECFLIDGGAMRLWGISVLPQAEMPDWQISAGEEKATCASDVYKLALLAVRLFARDPIATAPAALAVLSPALGDLARASLNPDRARRPTPSDWVEQLTTTAAYAEGTLQGLTQAHRERDRVQMSMRQGRDSEGRPHWQVLTVVGLWVAVLLAVASISVREVLDSFQLHARLGPSDTPAVVTGIVALTTATGTLIGVVLTAYAKYVQARGQAGADLIRAKAEMMRAEADVARARAGLPPHTPSANGDPPALTSPAEPDD